MPENLDYNFQEFACFLMIHASYADLEFSEEEKLMIKGRIGEEIFIRVHEDYKKMGDYQVLQVLMSYKDLYYPTKEKKEKLLTMITKLFSADGSYTKLEKNLHHFLEKLL